MLWINGFETLMQDNIEELLSDEPLADIHSISLVNDNEKKVDSEESNSAKSVAQFNSKQIVDILKKVNDTQNLILCMGADTADAYSN